VTRAVLDASRAVTLLVERDPSDVAALGSYDSLHAPAHFDIECISALRGLLLGRRISATAFVALSLAVPALPVDRRDISPLVPRIASLAMNATPYDAAYIALAEALDADLVTSDARLAAVPGIRCAVHILERG
jgi:predicted nucleic acid-binding protein